MLVSKTLAGAIVPLLLVLISSTDGLYEDQIKKFDWRRINIGGLQSAHLDLNHFQPRLLVSTREQVLASLCPKTGEILWRQVLEKQSRGNIKLFKLSGSSDDTESTAAARPNSNHGFDLLTVQGHAPALVRGWNSHTGTIEFEWSLMPLQTERALDAIWLYSHSFIYHVLPAWGSHIEVTQYFATSGQAVGTTSKIVAPWVNAENCVQSGTFFICVVGDKLNSLDVTSNKQYVVQLPDTETTFKLDALEGLNGVVVVNQKLYNVKNEGGPCTDLRSSNFAVGSFNQRRVIAQADLINNLLKITANYVDNCAVVEELQQSLPYPEQHGVPKLRTFNCKSKRGADGKGCLFIFDSSTDSILAVQQGKMRWVREESLANIIATQFIDLPVADSEGTLENEIKGRTGDIVSAFLHRITTQIIQIKNIFLHVIGLGAPPTDSQRAGLVRDSFGLHKMLIVLTKSGKIFGIDNISGKLHWQQFLPDVYNFANAEQMRLIVQRSAKHFPLEPLCAIVAKNIQTGNGVLYFFNPITGRSIDGGLMQLNYKIKQLSLLSETEKDYIQGVLLFDSQNKVHVYPAHTAEKAHGLYIYTADVKSAVLNGYYIQYQNNQLSSTAIWNVRLGGHAGDQKIVAVASKNPIERVHSQGRVLGDRSVLYKYINPNLVAVVTQANDPIHKYLLNLHLIDVVSGSVIFSMTHRKVRPPLHIVHSENWLAYSYFNDKVRRTEITTIELYEGKTQANSSVWSSLNAPPMPLIERQSYILPTIVESLRETITERGITNKHVLIGTSSGAIIEMPWALLDPRRPVASTTQGREEAAIPYIPELPLSPESFINYNQTIARLSNIYTAPSGLESTCLVVATGLDIFVTRVAPSKTFDLLKEDFDYILISIVLVALTSGSLVVKHLASRKALKQAWK